MLRDTEHGGHRFAETQKPFAPGGDANVSAPLSGDKPEPDASKAAKPMPVLHPATPSAPADAGGHPACVTHSKHAASEDISGPLSFENHGNAAGSGEGHTTAEAHSRAADPAIIDTIREQWRRRQAWHRAEKSLTLQAKALCRRLCGGDKGEAEKIFRSVVAGGDHELTIVATGAIFPLLEARASLEKQRKTVERQLEKLAKSLPVWEWVATVRGVGPLSLAGVVGEAGDVGSYKSVSALWKRMGLAVINGGRQRRVAGAEAIEHGYSAERRSLVWNIGGCIIKSGGELRAVYDARKEYEAERVETKAHAHNRAKRYMEKRFLRQLYAAWRGGHTSSATHRNCAAPTDPAKAGPDASRDMKPIGEAHPAIMEPAE